MMRAWLNVQNAGKNWQNLARNGNMVHSMSKRSHVIIAVLNSENTLEMASTVLH